jgi:hypothetical protein
MHATLAEWAGDSSSNPGTNVMQMPIIAQPHLDGRNDRRTRIAGFQPLDEYLDHSDRQSTDDAARVDRHVRAALQREHLQSGDIVYIAKTRILRTLRRLPSCPFGGWRYPLRV